MQKSKIFFQIFIWTFLVNIREAKPTSQNSERMQRRAITGQIPDLYGPIADIPPTFSSAIEVRTWCRQFMEPFFKREPQKLNAKVHRTLNSDCSLVGVFELDRANSPNTQIEFDGPNSERQKFSRACRTIRRVREFWKFLVFSVRTVQSIWVFGLFMMLRTLENIGVRGEKFALFSSDTRTANKFAENRHFHFVLELLGQTLPIWNIRE